MLMCDTLIVSMISQMLHTAMAVIILYTRWWSWAHMRCVGKLGRFGTESFLETEIQITKCEKSIFYQVLAKIQIKKSG